MVDVREDKEEDKWWMREWMREQMWCADAAGILEARGLDIRHATGEVRGQEMKRQTRRKHNANMTQTQT